jgi:hypothetical protein
MHLGCIEKVRRRIAEKTLFGSDGFMPHGYGYLALVVANGAAVFKSKRGSAQIRLGCAVGGRIVGN